MAEPSSQNLVPSNPLRWFPEFLTVGRRRIRSQARLYAASILVGVIAGLGAIAFYLATLVAVNYFLGSVVGYQAIAPAGEVRPTWLPEGSSVAFHPWLLLVVPTIGGLLSGLLVFTFAPEAEGHGTDAVIAAYHVHQGQIRPRVPLVKIIASALTIGSGGSGGREGPIAQIGAGFGSFLANVIRMRANERRILMAAGMGAGIAAIFRAPLAGALFAAEVLYCSAEFESDVIIPAGIASVVAYTTFGLYSGFGPLFSTPANLTFDNPLQLFPYLLLALFMVVLAMLYARSFYSMTYLFRRIHIPSHLKPPIGAFLTGAFGLGLYWTFRHDGRLGREVLAVLAFGYGILQDTLNVHLHELLQQHHAMTIALLLLSVSIGKILTTGLTIGSGGSGGVFGPSMVIGGCGGGALAVALHQIWPSLMPEQAIPSFVLVGMAGFFAAAAKTPFSTIVIVSEMTGSYHLLLPSLWVCAIAFWLSDEQSLYSSQVSSWALSPAHQGSYVRAVLAGIQVQQFVKIDPPPPALRPDQPLRAVLEQFDRTGHSVLPVVDEERRLLGVVNLEEVHMASRGTFSPSFILAADLMRTDVTPLDPEDRLDRALELFVENDLPALPVVSSKDSQKVIGLVKRYDVASAYLRQVQGQPQQSV